MSLPTMDKDGLMLPTKIVSILSARSSNGSVGIVPYLPALIGFGRSSKLSLGSTKLTVQGTRQQFLLTTETDTIDSILPPRDWKR